MICVKSAKKFNQIKTKLLKAKIIFLMNKYFNFMYLIYIKNRYSNGVLR